MKEEIFRQKSLDKVKSPENLDDYILVSKPGIWLILIGAIVLLVGACVWGIFGHIDSTVPTSVRVDDGQAVCMIAEEDISSVKVGQTVKFEGLETVIETIGAKADKEYVCNLAESQSLQDGIYEGKVVVESHKPISFILN